MFKSAVFSAILSSVLMRIGRGLFSLVFMALVMILTLHVQAALPPDDLRSAYAHRLTILDGQLVVSFPPDAAAVRRSLPGYLISSDGESWELPEFTEWHNRETFNAATEANSTQCHPGQTSFCVSITSDNYYEADISVSQDGGAQWVREFTLERARDDFRQRTPVARNSWNINYMPQDLLFFQFPDGDFRPVVALGSAGLLIRDLSGSWQIETPFFFLGLVPSSAAWYDIALIAGVLQEWLAATVLFLLLVAMVQTVMMTWRRRHQAKNRTVFLLVALAISVSLLISLYLIFFSGYVGPSPYGFFNFSILLLIVGLGVAWLALNRYQMLPQPLTSLFRLLILNSFGALICLLPLYFWAIDAIHELDLAQTLSICAAILLIPIVIWQFSK